VNIHFQVRMTLFSIKRLSVVSKLSAFGRFNWPPATAHWQLFS
jgi:hypothetical protein